MYLDRVLETLNDSGLDYCIQNGYEDMPHSCPSDIDIFYKGATEKELDEIVKAAATNANLRILQKIAMGYYHFVYWLTPELPKAGFQLELDFQSELSKRGMPHYYIPDKLLKRKRLYHGFFVPSPLDEIVYTVLRRTVKHNFKEKHLQVLKSAYDTNPTEIERGLREELPAHIAKEVIELINSNVSTVFEAHYASFYDYVRGQSRKNNNLNKKISQWWYNLTKMFPLRFLHPAGMDIALLSPDGGGKSTILNALNEYDVTSFSGVVRKYLRPELFHNIGQYKPNAKPEITDNPNPHGRTPDGILKSWIRFLIYLIDFTLGYAIKIVPLKWNRKLIVFDRYYYDYYVDMYRYHYSLSKSVPHYFSFLIPSPAITFILQAPADVIYNRKKELSKKETERQCKAFQEISKHIKNAVLIDVDRPIDAIVKDIVQHIISRRIELTALKLK